MKPILLKIKGLNSFVEEQLIDFSRLTENGLFGIFGPTGSGKSTVLDAIMLALYGRIPRSGGKPSGIVNTESEKAQVIYEFAVGEGQNRRHYSVQRVFKRTGADGVRAELATIHDISNPDEPRPLYEGSREVNTGIVAIIGLSAEDFTRSVVLPQGSFSEFLQLSGSDRRNMLERIFGMERYGDQITQMIRNYKGKQQNERTHLAGLLSSFQDITPDAYTSLNEECQNLRIQKEGLAQSWQELEQEYQKYAQVWAWQQEMEAYLQLEMELNGQQDTYARRSIALQQAENAAILKPLIDKVRAHQQELDARRQSLVIILKEKEDSVERLQLTSQSWEEAARHKEHQLPQLLIRQNNLEMAGKMAGQIRDLATERDNLREEYQYIMAALNQKEIALNNNKTESERIELILGIQREKIISLKLSPEYREQINEGVLVEKECIVLQAKETESLKKLATLETDLGNNQSQLTLLVNQRDRLEERCQERLSRRTELLNKRPGSNEDLLKQQNILNQMENELRSLHDWSQSWAEINQAQTKYHSQLLLLQQQLIAKKQMMAESMGQRDQLLINLDQEKNLHMAAILAQKLKLGEACPVCGSLHHPTVASEPGQASMQVARELLETTLQKIQTYEKEVHDLAMQQSYLVREIERQNNELAKLCEQIAGREMTDWQGKCIVQKRELEGLKAAIAAWETETSQNESGLAHDRELLGNLKNEVAFQTAALDKDRQAVLILQQEYELIKERLRASGERYVAFQLLLDLKQIEPRLIEIREMDRELQFLEHENQKLENTLKEYKSLNIALQEEVQGLKIKATQYQAMGSEKSLVIAQKNLEMQELCQNQEPLTGLKSVQAAIKAIHDSYTQATDAYEQAKQVYEELSRLAADLVVGNQTLAQILLGQEKDLFSQLETRRFDGVPAVLTAFMTEPQMKAEELSIQEYREQVQLNRANLARMEALLKDDHIAEEAWGVIQERRGQVQEELERATNRLLLSEAKQADMGIRMQELTRLETQKREIDRQYELLEELESIFKGKKFIDFIARTRLHYMAKEASKTLRDISRGRYALELNPEGEFVIRDDFSGGVRRPTHTLSGGETFLTSLALALALSSHIQLGKASLEFFFLDEGFGTLDVEVLDLVIGALEKLHSEKLSVGIISHVEELKYRIPRKLIMNPARPGISGTTVNIT